MKVRTEECDGARREVELMFEFVDEFGVRDRVVGFGEVDVDGEGGTSSVPEAMKSVEHCFQCHGAGGIGPEGVLSG